MSASVKSIPKSAEVIRYAHCVSPDGSRSATLTVHRAHISLGYQSDYSRLAAQWYELDATMADGSHFRRAWRYTGSRIDRAIADYSTALTEIVRDGWRVTV